MTLDLTTPPLMRKLLIGQLLECPTGPTYDSVRQVWSMKSIHRKTSDLCWNLVWLQGYVIPVDITTTTTTTTTQNQFVLDDSTGRLTVQFTTKESQSHMYQPNSGDLVAVVGKLTQSELHANTIGPVEYNTTNWLVIAKSITHLGQDRLSDEPIKQLSSQAAAELSWPLEVIDMTCAL